MPEPMDLATAEAQVAILRDRAKEIGRGMAELMALADAPDLYTVEGRDRAALQLAGLVQEEVGKERDGSPEIIKAILVTACEAFYRRAQELAAKKQGSAIRLQ